MFKYLYIAFALLCFSNNSEAQDLQESMQLADQYQRNGDYEQAIKLYRRVVYFDTSYLYSAKLFKQMGNAFFSMKQFEEGAQCFDKSFKVEIDSIQQNDCIIAQTRCLLALGKYIEAIGELQNLTVDLPDSQFRQKHYYLGICYYFNSEMDSSENHLIKLMSNDSNQHFKLHQLFVQTKRIERINPGKAKTMSKFIPGLGQFYAHDYKNAVNSFILNIGLASLFVLTSYNYSVLDAVLSVYPWFQRYYIGGANKAYLIAEKRKANLKKQQMIQMISLINQ